MCTPLQKLAAKGPPQNLKFPRNCKILQKSHTLYVSREPTQKSIQKASTHKKGNGFEYDKKDIREFSFQVKWEYVKVLTVGKNRKHVVLENISLQILLNPLNAELNPICHLLALLGAHHILHVSRIRVTVIYRSKKRRRDGVFKLKRNNRHKIKIIGRKGHISSGCSNCHYHQAKPPNN